LKREDGGVEGRVEGEREERMRVGAAPGEEREGMGGMGGMGRESAILRAVEERKAEVVEAREREAERQRSGGMLDRLGTGLGASGDSSGETPKQGGWMAFMSRR
jgi:hypothetical protein